MHPTLNGSALFYNFTEVQGSQIHRENVVQDNDSWKHTQVRWEDAKFSDKYFTYQDDFIEMLTRIQLS